LAVEKNMINNGWNMYMYKESFSPNVDKPFFPTCFADKENRTRETASKVELA
jgi:hypothetical protein